MKIKFLSTIKKTAYQTVKIAGITLVMLMMAYGIDLTNEAAVSLAADYYYIDANIGNQSSYIKGAITDYSVRPEVWVNDEGLLKAKVWDYESKNRNNILQEDNGMFIRYATNAFVRDGNLSNGDKLYFCGANSGRVSGIGTLHNKYILMCPDWNNDYGHVMEKGEVYNGVVIQTTGKVFFGRDAELTQECLQQLAAVGVNINAPTQLTDRLYVRDSIYTLYPKSLTELMVAEDYYAPDKNRGCTYLSHHDHDYPYAVTAYADENEIETTGRWQEGFDANDFSTSYRWAEEVYRADDGDWLRYDWDGSAGFEYDMQIHPDQRESNIHYNWGLNYVGTSHR